MDLYVISPSTAATSLLGPTGAQATVGLGLVDGSLFGPCQVGPVLDLCQFGTGGGSPVIGPITGANGLVYGIAQPVPEPMTMTLVRAGLLLGLRRRRSL